jgi:arginyl-tRNA synthetase
LGEKNKLDSILTQFVRVIKDGKEVKMSKRKGVYFALDDLIDEVGRDAVRFIFSSYDAKSHINFDIDLAKERSEKNPVYYVQYAHARISSILRKSEIGKRGSTSLDQNGPKRSNLELLTHEKELSLIRELNKFPELIEEISQSYAAHKLPHYAIKLADKFHSFYDACRVIDEENPELSQARLNLVNAVRIVLAETLRLMGVNAPEKM